MNSRLFQRDFSIMILGQIISLFGNSILRFSLSLYVLDVTGSAAVFGTILAVSMIPTLVLSPFGGVLADRLPKQKIMAILDFVTAGMIVSYDVIFGSIGSLAAVAVFMILLTLIQAFYQPAVQASIPLLAAREHLMAANGIVMQVQALAGLLGPILAGMLYGIGGVKPILAASAVCFFLSAVMELFLRIPHDGRGTPVLLLMAELLVIADVQMHTNILRYLLQIAFSILRTYKTFLRMSRKNQFQNISSRFQYLRGCRLHDHSLRNRCTARGRKKSLSFYLNHTDTADRLDAQILMIAESRNVDTGFLRRLEDRRSFLHLYRLSVDCQMYHHASLPPFRSNRPA